MKKGDISRLPTNTERVGRQIAPLNILQYVADSGPGAKHNSPPSSPPAYPSGRAFFRCDGPAPVAGGKFLQNQCHQSALLSLINECHTNGGESARGLPGTTRQACRCAIALRERLESPGHRALPSPRCRQPRGVKRMERCHQQRHPLLFQRHQRFQQIDWVTKIQTGSWLIQQQQAWLLR